MPKVSFPRTPHFSYWVFFAFFLSLLLGYAATTSIDFETYPVGSIATAHGWRVDKGEALVVESEAYNGQKSLELRSNGTDAAVYLPWILKHADIVTLHFAVKGLAALTM